MKNFIVYLPSGKIVKSGTCQESDFSAQAEPGTFIMEGLANGADNYIDNGLIAKKPEKPGNFYEFDYTQKQWVLNVAEAENQAKYTRDRLLKEGPDRISPLWWDSMTTEQREQWAAYRKALLDITEQPGYPVNIIWPVSP